MEQKMAITIEGLVKDYGSQRALRGLDLEVLQGEIYGFLGPNGAGKTTTIRCLLDSIRPTAGRVSVLGLDSQKDPVAVRALVGYLPGELSLEGNSKVRTTLKFFNDLRGRGADWVFIESLSERLGLDLDQKIKNLSKGNKQKVGVVQAFMHRPALLLLDEPTSGLDPLIQREVHGLVREAREGGATVFFSSHVLSEVEQLADRVGIIRDGELVEVADPSELVHRSLLRVEIRFQEPVDPSPLASVEGLRVLSSQGRDGLRVEVEGEMDSLIKVLAGFPVRRLETELPSLEEIFMVYYRR